MNTMTAAPAATDKLAAAAAVANDYLAAMEARDLARAARFVAPGAVFVFPGGAQRENLADIVAGSATRYQFVGKHIAGCDAAPAADGGVNV